MTPIKQALQWLKSLAFPLITREPEAACEFDSDLAWRGDHWQNLLASPLDARHYVMEDWCTPRDGDLVGREEATSRA